MKNALTRNTISIYWQAATKYRWLALPLFIIIPLAVFFNNYAQPFIISEVINRLTESAIPQEKLWSTFAPWIIAFVASAIFGELVLWRLVLYLSWKLETYVVFDLYMSCFSHLTNQSIGFHNNRFGGSLVSQTSKFTGSYIRLSDTMVFNIIPLISALSFTFIILGPRLPVFTLILAMLCGLFIFIALKSFKAIRPLNSLEAEANNKISGELADSVTNINAVKSHGNETIEIDRFSKSAHEGKKASLRTILAITKRDFGFGAVLIAISITAFTTLIGGHSWFNVQLGTLVLAITYSMQILQRLWDFNGILRNLNRVFGDSEEMVKILNIEAGIKDKNNAKALVVKNSNINFSRSTFTHADTSKNDVLFKNFSLNIKPGERIGLVGHSGSGKTTLTKLLLRFMDLDSGSIKIDGQVIATVTQESLRKNIAYVPQEPVLFHRSLKENIAYGKPGASEQEIKRAAKLAHAAEFIDKLPKKYETLVGERGVKLSGGQRQRVAIARAILKNAPVLVLDEATSALDSESEKYIQVALWKLMEGRTSIVIAHRLSTIQKMDRIVVLDNGKIIEQGNHQELLAKNGVYAKLWAHQSGGFIEE